MSKVTVIIPVYNVEEYLKQCLDSVSCQTLRDIEIICVDDGSPDNSGKILDEYATRDKRVVVLHQKNNGVAYSRNRAIKRAKGEFVIFMDPDDFYPDDKILEKLYTAAKKHNANICGGSFSSIEAKDGSITTKYPDVLSGYTFASEGWQKFSDYQFDFGYHRFLFKTALLTDNNIFFPPYARYQDPPFFVKAMLIAKKFYHIPDIVYRYRNSTIDAIKWTPRKLCDHLNASLLEMNMCHKNKLKLLYTQIFERVSGGLHWLILTQYNDDEVLVALENFYKNINFEFMYGTTAPININLMDSVTVLKWKQDEINDLKTANKLLSAENESIKQSISWKITKPIRTISAIIRKIATRR
jgi:Glycosyltransferases involved in cell wall biogenesis